ncbi:acetylglutamate kinase [Streptomyces parvulus]|uniref:Acetylglutamate kinase n=1 Tax=Streptomyces parvulus TaxID=146923 RepID=A0ABV5DMP8_9ACTN|nr:MULTISPECIES: acetylglutamate kinase [Streptomyces]MCC9158674.1 acetylglutamate kinase [Streptomyces parvulus]MCE7691574.1 acetylglutamate kinase [Streptomyces parvulus]MCQ4192508.1 acetylglutamate kinase [Streptomyces parvulus]WHM28484.1 acetylglutamate kinase [Streptomyces sp. BPPL-273]GGS04139.1 acetylglutamate kinase [Streptomyces parvulus]
MGTGLTVVKCGGTAEVRAEAVCAGVARLVREKRPVVLVHGGSATVTELAGRLGVPLGELVAPDGTVSRRTDPATLEVVTLALAGKAKPALLLELARFGVPAVGLTGLDAGLLRARRKTALRTVVDGRTVVVRDDRSGRLTSVATPLLHALLAEGMVPVLSPPALAEDGLPVNVNADRVAAAVAAALDASRLVLLTGAPGVLADSADPGSLRARYQVGDGRDPAVGGGMTVKITAAREALEAGVGDVRIADGRFTDTVADALDGLGGTRIVGAETTRRTPR